MHGGEPYPKFESGTHGKTQTAVLRTAWQIEKDLGHKSCGLVPAATFPTYLQTSPWKRRALTHTVHPTLRMFAWERRYKQTYI